MSRSHAERLYAIGKRWGSGEGHARYRHGHNCKGKRTPEYRAWLNMRARCMDPGNSQFSDYGGRGISVCDRWLDFSNFLADMGIKPSSGHSIDRIDNDGNYEPQNCRWATKLEQASNTRASRRVTINGETFPTLRAAADFLGVARATLRRRLRNETI